jgi:CheY-like chemotaxis protein
VFTTQIVALGGRSVVTAHAHLEYRLAGTPDWAPAAPLDDPTLPVNCNVRAFARCDPEQVGRCMIVDDNERFLAVARVRLTRDGLDVVGTATTQKEALAKAEELQPDVVLVDISLGTESGFDLTRRLVEDFPSLESRVVLISTRDQDDFADLIAASPAAGFLPKNLLSASAVLDLVSVKDC